MSAHCMLTGAAPGFGNRISHSHRRTPRRFDPTVDAIGVEAAVARIRARGVRI
ncbi:bL28 family ribosomal protein [Streptomyces sp. NPDC056637]|uniref:large ribosomal subunit protein bL28 n=1 Tax=unclassified Streptomyces TaxID=2593676 RepID=UPI00367783D5